MPAFFFFMPLYMCLSMSEHPQYAEAELTCSQFWHHLKFFAFELLEALSWGLASKSTFAFC